MPRFAANVSLLYSELPFLERFAAAASDGFKAVECQFPYEHAAADIAARLAGAGLQLVLLNAPPGDSGEKGLAALPGRDREFRESIAKALEYAMALGCPRVHVMAGLVPTGGDVAAMRRSYIDNLRYAATEAAKSKRDIVIEPLNARDNPGYFLSRQAEAHAIITEVGTPNLKIQFDLYHVQIAEGDLATKIRQFLPSIGHVQIAGVPERHEPTVGEINYPYLFALLDELGYRGWIGCEYRPQAGTRAGLGWLKPHL